MKKETFVGIINSIKEQQKRQDAFGEAIKKAYVDAGECSDFRERDSYTPATSVFIDDLLKSISLDFVSNSQTQEEALDLINYFMWELDMMNYTFMEPVNPEENNFIVEPVPAYIIHQDGTKLQLSTPEELWYALMYCRCVEGEEDGEEQIKKVSPEEHLASALEQTKFDEDRYDQVWQRLKPIFKDAMDLDEEELAELSVHDRFQEELGLDSLDYMNLTLHIENEFSIDLSMEEVEKVQRIDDLIKVIIKNLPIKSAIE